MNEWDDYKIKIPKPGERADNVSELDEINHVVHPAAARRILVDGKIRAGIVHDESRMNNSRHHVVWLSANTWAPGSIYGTVQFTFPWEKVIEGRKMFWVEAMTYPNPAYRLLVTNKDVSHLAFLKPYDPAVDKGPVRFRNGTWYWNSKDTSEFLVDSDFDLSDCIGFKGIAHRKDRCRIYKSSCPELEVLHFITGGRMLAFLISSGIHAVDSALKIPPEGSSRPFSYDLDNAVSGIWFLLVNNKDSRFKGSINKIRDSKAIVMGALSLFGNDRPDEARNLVGLLDNETTFQSALEEIVNDHFGTTGWKLPS